MMRLKKGLIAAVLLGSITVLSGCSIKDTWDILWGHNEEKGTEADSATKVETFDPDAVKVDDSVEAPKFKPNLKGSSTYAVGDKAKELKVEASVKGEGKITYQWYVNTVDSNGGGAKIDGATDVKYTPDTSKDGYYYYFVVATNTIGKNINLTTSKMKEIIVDPDAEPAAKEGEAKKGWNQDKKGWYYLNKKGKKVKDKVQEIEGSSYGFDKKGYMLTGWKEVKGKWYFFDDKGIMATGSLEQDGKKYFMSAKGDMHIGWLDGDGNWLYAKEDGVLVVDEWIKIDGAWYYFNEDGVMLSNCSVDGKWLNPDGKLAE